jgi:hypothetical protein
MATHLLTFVDLEGGRERRPTASPQLSPRLSSGAGVSGRARLILKSSARVVADMPEPDPAADRGHRMRTGIAGEFFVAAELSKRGWIATLTAKNTPDVDVLAARPTGDTYARIQVKTRTSAYKYAHRVGREMKLVGDHDFLVLVDLGEALDGPRYWIVPTGVAAGLLRNEQIRISDVQEFEGRWERLDEGSSQTPPSKL